MDDEIGLMLSELPLRPGASEGALADLERFVGHVLPPDYAAFLRCTDGFEGPLGSEEYVALWGAAEAIEGNIGYEAKLAAPGIFLIGSDGGGEAIGFDTRREDWPVVEIPFIVMQWEDARVLAGSFREFFAQLRADRGVPK